MYIAKDPIWDLYLHLHFYTLQVATYEERYKEPIFLLNLNIII